MGSNYQLQCKQPIIEQLSICVLHLEAQSALIALCSSFLQMSPEPQDNLHYYMIISQGFQLKTKTWEKVQHMKFTRKPQVISWASQNRIFLAVLNTVPKIVPRTTSKRR